MITPSIEKRKTQIVSPHEKQGKTKDNTEENLFHEASYLKGFICYTANLKETI